MKIKHWAGYGCLNAKKINREIDGNTIKLSIKVTGNHEQGLLRTDTYDLYNWLIKRFDKSISSYRDIIKYEYIIDNETNEHGQLVETCTYTFYCKTHN